MNRRNTGLFYWAQKTYNQKGTLTEKKFLKSIQREILSMRKKADFDDLFNNPKKGKV